MPKSDLYFALKKVNLLQMSMQSCKQLNNNNNNNSC